MANRMVRSAIRESGQGMDRLSYIDTAKGLGMLLVLWAHIMLGGWTNSFIYAFHMPLFFFLSGMMFRREKYRGFKQFFVKRVKTLLIPYVFYSFASWIVWALYVMIAKEPIESYWMPLLQTFIAQGSGGFLVHNVPLWFVTCLFVTEMLYFLIDHLPEWANILVCTGLSILGYWMIQGASFFDFTLLPWSSEVALTTLLFYAGGNILLKHISHKQLVTFCSRRKGLCLIAAVLLGVVVYFGSQVVGHISMGSDLLGDRPVLFYLDAFCGLWMLLLFSIALCAYPFKNFVVCKLMQGVQWIGRYSFRVMAIHNPVKGFVVAILAKLLCTSADIVATDSWMSAVAFIISLAVVCTVVLFINRGLFKLHKICNQKGFKYNA